jgi:6-phosphogluconolactonase
LPAIQTIAHTGKSINKQRQEKAHVHATVISADNKYLLVPDLGMDKIMLYKFDAIKGALSPTTDSFAAVQAGAGPRHIVFHPNQQYAYLTQELTGTIAAFKYNDGKLKLIQTISTVSENFKGNFSVADIHISNDGKFLYASNRADAESIALYAVNAETGILTNIGYQPCMGIKPRNFTISPDNNYLLVANQESSDIIIFKRNTTTGILHDTGKRIIVQNPVCLKWLED